MKSHKKLAEALAQRDYTLIGASQPQKGKVTYIHHDRALSTNVLKVTSHIELRHRVKLIKRRFKRFWFAKVCRGPTGNIPKPGEEMQKR